MVVFFTKYLIRMYIEENIDIFKTDSTYNLGLTTQLPMYLSIKRIYDGLIWCSQNLPLFRVHNNENMIFCDRKLYIDIIYIYLTCRYFLY